MMKISAVVLLHINLFHLFIFFYHLTTARLHPPYLGIFRHNNGSPPPGPTKSQAALLCNAHDKSQLRKEGRFDMCYTTISNKN